MGVFRNISSRVKSIEEIVEDLKNTGVAKDEVETYEF